MASIIPGFQSGDLAALLQLGSFQAGAFSQNSASVYFGIVFKASASASMTGFKLQLGSNGGTPTNGVKANLYAVDANYQPTGAALATISTGVTPTNNTLNAFTWDSPYTLTAGTTYIVVINNAATTPGTNFIRGLYYQSLGCPVMLSIDSGTTWSCGTLNGGLQSSQFVGFYEVYSSTVYGYHCGGGSVSASVGFYNVSGSRIDRRALKVNLGNATAYLWGIRAVQGTFAGSPTYHIQGEVCSLSASLSTSATRYYVGTTNQNAYLDFLWDSPYLLAANTDYYIGVTPVELSNGSVTMDSSNRWLVSSYGENPQPTNVLGAIKGTFVSTASPGPTWSEDTSNEFAANLLLEIVSGGGAAGLYPRMGVNGGVF